MNAPSLEDVQSAVGDRYEVLDLAGTGGMGAVFRARHRSLGHIVAVKVLPPEIAPSAVLQERFKREAALAANLSHPNLVPVYEFDTRAGITFLIMPYVRGQTLEHLLGERGRLQPSVMRRVLRDVGAGLHFAHLRGVVHRDVKPSNILIEDESGRALLTDFGIAHVPQSAGTALTVAGAAIGTPAYMAPEQMVGLDEVDGRADLYALGLVVFEALTGTRPSLGTDRATLARALRGAQPEVSTKLAAALVAPIADRPGDRPLSVGAWLDLIDRAWTRPWARLAAAGAAILLLAIAGWNVLSRSSTRPADVSTVAVFPFAVLRAPPDLSPTQLTEFFATRLSAVPDLKILSPAKVASRAGAGALSQSDCQAVAEQFEAKYCLLGTVDFAGPRVTLSAKLHEARTWKLRGEGEATGSVDSLSDVMDAVGAQVLSRVMGEAFARTSAVTLPHTLPALVAYASAEDAFRRGDYDRALEEYNRVIAHDSNFAVAYFRRALAVAQVAPTEENLRRELEGALASAQRNQVGLSPADSLLLDGYRLLFERGDGLAALERFEVAAERAPDQPYVWFVLAEFYLYFGNLFDQDITEAERAFDEVLNLVPRFASAIANSISLAHLRGDDQETRRLIREYQALDSTSVVAKVVGIVDTILFGSPAAQLRVMNETLDERDFIVLEYLAFQLAQFGGEDERRVYGRDVLQALGRKASTDAQRALALRMGLAADLRAGWIDSARARLGRASAPATARERDSWILLAHATGLESLGDWQRAAEQVGRRIAAGADTDAVARWLLARSGVERDRHGVALRRLAEADSAPLPVSLSLDLKARQSLAAGDTSSALVSWDAATRRYAVLSVPFDLVASLWPIRLELIRVALAQGDTARAERVCATFGALVGYVDQVAYPEVERLCARWRESAPAPSPS